MSGLYELEGIPKAYSIQAAEVQKSREAKIGILDFYWIARRMMITQRDSLL